uniref:Uncharacterized protein n=1 Tax=Vitis vinifera TaxID=29760 RepID=F6I4E1_VITVI
MEEFHAYYDILNDVRVVFPENLDDLRSTLSSSYGEIFFTWEQFRMKYGIGDFERRENDLCDYISDIDQLKHTFIELESDAQDLTKML